MLWGMTLRIALLVVLPLTCRWALPQELPRGRIIEKVACAANPGQSYALYLPSRYTRERQWPIVYAFDAGARGLLPVQRFREAAEKYGYIVAGSNNSKNGPINIVEDAVRALLADTDSKFSLNPKRMYLTGFSGGARVAVSVGFSLQGRVAGVIACGAGFPYSIMPSASVPFSFYGIAGNADFNFPEMRELDRNLAEYGIAHRLNAFSGGHDWPPTKACMEAIEWMELQAIRSGLKVRDDLLIDSLYAEGVASARSSEEAKRMYEAFVQYSNLAQDFDGFRDVAHLKARAKQLQAHAEVRKALALEREIEKGQLRAETAIARLLQDAVTGDRRAFAVQELVGTLDGFRKQAAQKENERDRLTAARVLDSTWIRLNEAAAFDLQRGNYRQAISNLEIMARIRPENPQVHFQLARSFALAGDRKGALRSLEKAIEKGFADLSALQGSPDFESLKQDPQFQKLLQKLASGKR